MKNRKLIPAVCAMSLAAVLAAAPVLAADTDSDAVSAAESAAESMAESAAESIAEDVLSAAESIAEEVEIPERPAFNPSAFVTLGAYKGLTVTDIPVEVTDDEIETEITSRITLSDEGTEVFEEGTIEEGDIANIDYEGKKDGVAFDGGSAQGYDLEIGSGTFIPGFEDGLIGVSVGDTVDIPLTFPEEYHNEELAGQEVVFTVTVNSISRYKDLDDELASALSGGEAETVDDYRELVKGELLAQKEDSRDAELKQQLLDLVIAGSTFEDFPEEVVEYDKEDMKRYYTSMAGMYGVSLEDFMAGMYGISLEQFEQLADLSVRQSLQRECCLSAIADTENLASDEEAMQAAYDALAADYGFEDGASLIETYGESAVRNAVINDLVMNFLLENANIVEGTDSFAESVAEDVLSETESVAEDLMLSAAEEAES